MRPTSPWIPRALLSLSSLAAASSAHAQLPLESLQRTRDPVYYCKSKDFNLPFNVSNLARTPSELELEVSSDGGQSWKVAERARAEARSFRFQASSDGYFMFRLQMVEANGSRSLASETPIQIVVDSQGPQGELSVDVNPQGELVASFLIHESNLVIDSVKLEYRTEHDDRWIKIETALQQGNDPSETRGSGVWDIPLGTHQLVLRLVAVDQAGNEFETFRYPQLPRTAGLNAGMQLASQQKGGSIFGNSRGNAARMSPSAGPTLRVPEPPQASGRHFVATKNPVTQDPARSSTEEVLPTPQAVPMASNSPAFELPPSSSNPADAANAARPNETPVSLGPPSTPPFTPNSSFLFKQEPAPDGPAIQAAKHPLGIEPFYSNSRTFSLDYDLESNPVIGIQRIELWGTTDGGKTWENWGADPDRMSPMDVAVEEDGTFGFRIVTISDNGIATNRPVNGEQADVWIEVDSQAPLVTIVSAQYGRGVDAGSLVIEYQASDPYLHEAPISLSISETAQGPWVTASTGQANNGRFVWVAQPGLPKQVYLRLEAMDRAGNIGEHRFDLPVDISALSPRGRIQGVRPIRQQ